MSSPADNLFLMICIQINKIVTIPGNPNQKIFIFIRVLLGLFQRRCIHHIKLNMVSTEGEVGSYQTAEFVKILFRGKDTWQEALIEQGSP